MQRFLIKKRSTSKRGRTGSFRLTQLLPLLLVFFTFVFSAGSRYSEEKTGAAAEPLQFYPYTEQELWDPDVPFLNEGDMLPGRELSREELELIYPATADYWVYQINMTVLINLAKLAKPDSSYRLFVTPKIPGPTIMQEDREIPHSVGEVLLVTGYEVMGSGTIEELAGPEEEWQKGSVEEMSKVMGMPGLDELVLEFVLLEVENQEGETGWVFGYEVLYDSYLITSIPIEDIAASELEPGEYPPEEELKEDINDGSTWAKVGGIATIVAGGAGIVVVVATAIPGGQIVGVGAGVVAGLATIVAGVCWLGEAGYLW